MGVKSLWQILAPASRAVRLETLQGQVLAIDASIWLFQFLKAMRDSESGESLEGSHLLGFFRRICKLLFWGVKPIFVFDGAAPALKQATLAERRKRKEGKEIDVTRTARQLLSTQLQLASIDQSVDGSSRPISIGIPKSRRNAARDPFALPKTSDWSAIVQERATLGAASRKNEDIRMPLLREELETISEEDMGDPSISRPPHPTTRAATRPSTTSAADDARYAADESDFLRQLAMLQSLESARSPTSAAQAQLDEDAAYAAQQFKSMPVEAQHELLTRLKDRSRAPSLRRVAQMIRASQSAMDFSKLQIQALMRRNFLTQTLHAATGFAGAGGAEPAAGGTGGRVRRIASDRRRAYVLTKNENGIGFKFDTAKDHGTQILEANEIDRASLDVVASDRASFPLVAADKVLEFVGDDAFLDEDPTQSTAVANNDENDDDDGLLPFEPVVATALPPEVADMLDILPQHFSNTFSLGTEMLHSAVGWTAAELQQALMDCKARVDSIKLLLATGDPEQVEHYENLTFWADFLDMLIARRERLDRDTERIMAETAAAAAARKEQGTSRKRGRHAFAVDSESDVDDSYERPAKRHASDPDEMDLLLASSSSDVIISHPVDGGFLAPVMSHGRRHSLSQSNGGTSSSASLPLPQSRRSNMFAMLDDSDSDSDEVHVTGDSLRSSHALADATHSCDLYDDGMVADTAFDWQRSVSPQASPSHASTMSIAPLFGTLPPTAPRSDIADESNESDDDDAIFEPDTTTSRPAPTSLPVTRAAEDDADNEEESFRFEGVSSFRPEERPTVDLDDQPRFAQESARDDIQDGVEDEDEDVEFVDVLPFEPQPPSKPKTSPRKSSQPTDQPRSPPPEPLRPLAPTPPSLSHLQSEPVQVDSQEQQRDPVSDDEDELFMLAAAQRAEDDQFGKFLSEVQMRDLSSIQADLERERASLEAKIRTERRDADVVTPEMVAETQALLRLFGIPYITAPAEAEAQCAWLAKEGLVDGVVSDDSDTFLFGAPIVYKNMFTNAKYVECYTAEGIEQTLQLDVSSLIQLAYLLGSDYTSGIQGIGAVLAMEALVAFPGGMQEFAEWARDPQASATVVNNPQATATRKKLKRVAANVPTHFPDPAVEQAYLRPIVDESREPYTWGVPDVNGIKNLLWERLQWHPDKTESTLNPVVAAYSKARAGRGQRQTTLFGFGFTGYIPNAKSRTKGITSERMKQAIEAKRSQKAGTTAASEGAKGKSNAKARPVKPLKGSKSNKGRRKQPSKLSESESSLSASESDSSDLSDASGDGDSVSD